MGQASTHTVTTTDQHVISYDHYQNGHDKVVIIAHGFYNSKQALLMKELGEALQSEYDIITMDFRGHGKSGGLFHWTSKEYLDMEAVLKFASGKYKKIGVVGFSLGAATSMIVASQNDSIASLISVSGPTEFSKIEYHFWGLDPEHDLYYTLLGQGRIGKGVRPGPFWLSKKRPIDCVGKIKCPVLYIHGEKDWLIKPWHSEQLFQKTNSKKQLVVIKKGPHAESLVRKNKEEIIRPIREWFKETL